MLPSLKSHIIRMLTALILLSCLLMSQSLVIAKAGTGYEDNPLLQKTISVNAVPISLNALCERLGGSRITISASKEYNGQLLQMNLVDKPVWQIMKALATLLSGTWQRNENGDGYILEMRISAIRQRRIWWRTYNALTHEIKQQVETNCVQELSHPTSHSTSGSEYTNINLSLNSQPDLFYGVSRISPEFFELLGSDILTRISKKIRFYSAYSPMEYYAFERPEGNVIITSKELPDKIKKILSAPRRDFGVKIKNGGELPKYFVINFIVGINSIDFEFISQNTVSSYTSPTYFYTSPSLQEETLMLNPFFIAPASLPENVILPDLYLKLKADENLPFPQLIATKDATQHGLKSSQQNYSDNAPFTWHSYADNTNSSLSRNVLRTDKLEWLAKVAGMQYISDYYSVPGETVIGNDRLTYLPHPLDMELNQMAKANQSSWGKDSNGIILVRDNMWFREDRLQPDQQSIREMWTMVHHAEDEIKTTKTIQHVDVVKEKLELALENYIQKHFTPLQIEDALQFYVLEPADDGYAPPNPAYPLKPFASVAMGLLQDRSLLKLFFSLNPEEQNTFLTGKLPISELTVKQRENACKCFPSLLTFSPNSQQFKAIKMNLTAQIDGYGISQTNTSYNASSNMAILPDFRFQLNEFPRQIWK